MFLTLMNITVVAVADPAIPVPGEPERSAGLLQDHQAPHGSAEHERGLQLAMGRSVA